MKTARIVHITWVDSSAFVGWEETKDICDELAQTHSIGILLKETGDSVVIGHSYDPSTQTFNGRIHIPICAIQEMIELCKIPMT